MRAHENTCIKQVSDKFHASSLCVSVQAQQLLTNAKEFMQKLIRRIRFNSDTMSITMHQNGAQTKPLPCKMQNCTENYDVVLFLFFSFSIRCLGGDEFGVQLRWRETRTTASSLV